MMVIGKRRREGRQQVDRFSIRKFVDQFVCQRLDAGPQFFDLPRDEGAVDERAQPCVDRRLEFQHRMRLDRVESGKVRAVAVGAAAVGNACGILPAEASVAQQPVDVVKTAKAPVAEFFPEERTALGVQPRIGLVGILIEPLVARIEPQPTGCRVETQI